jgi:hypothetical protein
MKKLKILGVTLMMFFVFINNLQANQKSNEITISYNEIKNSQDTDVLKFSNDKDITISITLTFGRASKNCKGFGICKATITITLKKGSFVAMNSDGHFALLLNNDNMKTIKSYFQQDAIILEEDFVLPKEITDKLELKDNYVLKKGKYKVDHRKKGKYIIF